MDYSNGRTAGDDAIACDMPMCSRDAERGGRCYAHRHIDQDFTLSAAAAAAPKPRAEIEAEKAAKPRPDLLPPAALALALHHKRSISEAFDAFARFTATRDRFALGSALDCILFEIGGDRATALMAAGEIMGVGLRKHGPCTWRIAGTEQADPQTHYASAVRHILEHCAGVTVDPDSGKHPLLHAVCQIAIMLNLIDDPPNYPEDNDGRAMIGRPK
jgi:hypothetical protein